MKVLVGMLVVLASVAPACGSNSSASSTAHERLTKQQYQSRLHELAWVDGVAATQLFDALVTGPRPQADCASDARAFRAQLRAILTKVEALSPPENVAEFQDEFLTAAGESVDKVNQVLDDVEAGKLACGDEVNRAIYGLPSTDRAERAVSRIESKGYVIFGE
jgi:hypothetical protein